MQQDDAAREWLRYQEAELYSGLSHTTLWRSVRSNSIKAAKVGRAVRISRQSLEEFMERHATQPQLPGFNDADH